MRKPTAKTVEEVNIYLEYLIAQSSLRYIDTGEGEWNDLRVSLSTGIPNTSPPTFGTFRNGVQAWAFGAGSTEQLYFEAQMPHGWVIGSEVRPHIHWSPGNSTNTGAVVWELEYTWQNAGDEVFPATTTVTVQQVAAGVAYAHQIASFPPSTARGNVSRACSCVVSHGSAVAARTRSPGRRSVSVSTSTIRLPR